MAKAAGTKAAVADAHVKFELSEHFPYLFKHIHSQLDVASAGKLAKYGVNVAVWRILAVLWEHDNLSNRELAHLTSIEVSTLSRVSKVVQRDGLIRRKRTMEDQRTVRVTLTEKGKALAQTIIPVAQQWQHEMIADMSQDDIATLTRLLHRVVENLNKYSEVDAHLLDDTADEPVVPVVRGKDAAKLKKPKVAKLPLAITQPARARK